MSNSSRFAKYDAGDFPPLLKLQVGETFTATLTGEHEFEGDNGPVPVLELLLPDGAKAGWMCGTWHGLQQLALADPQHGDTVRATRLPDVGKSHRYDIEVPGDQEVPAASSPAKAKDAGDDPVPF
jgi:hypothetical protein